MSLQRQLVAARAHGGELVDRGAKHGRVAGARSGEEDALARGGQQRLGAVEDFLEQLLARTHAGDLDLDVDVGALAG